MCKRHHASWRLAPQQDTANKKVLSDHPQGGVFAHFGTELLRFLVKVDSVIYHVTGMNW